MTSNEPEQAVIASAVLGYSQRMRHDAPVGGTATPSDRPDAPSSGAAPAPAGENAPRPGDDRCGPAGGALCVHDPLTGVYNRRHFEMLAESEWIRALRHRRPLSLLLFEVAAGPAGAPVPAIPDDQLGRIAARAQTALRTGGDVLARDHGARFAVLLPETDAAGARMMAERLHRAVEDFEPPAGGGKRSVWVGAATLTETGAGEKGWRGTLEVAERALHRAHQDAGSIVLIEITSPSF